MEKNMLRADAARVKPSAVIGDNWQ